MVRRMFAFVQVSDAITGKPEATVAVNSQDFHGHIDFARQQSHDKIKKSSSIPCTTRLCASCTEARPL